MLQNYDFYSKAKSQNGKNVGQNGKKAHFPHFDRSNQFKPFKPKFKPKLKPKLKPSSNQIQTIRTHLEPKFKPFEPSSNPIQTPLEIHIGSHAACNAKGGSNSRSYRHDELNNQLPSVLFRFSTHKKNKF